MAKASEMPSFIPKALTKAPEETSPWEALLVPWEEMSPLSISILRDSDYTAAMR